MAHYFIQLTETQKFSRYMAATRARQLKFEQDILAALDDPGDPEEPEQQRQNRQPTKVGCGVSRTSGSKGSPSLKVISKSPQ